MQSTDSNDLHFALDPNYVTNNGAYYISCETITEFTFEIQGMPFSISPLDYIGPPDNSIGNGGMCLSNIKANDSLVGEGHWEVGTGFLRNVYPRVC
jgi:Eukaryotic aspartyl protease